MMEVFRRQVMSRHYTRDQALAVARRARLGRRLEQQCIVELDRPQARKPWAAVRLTALDLEEGWEAGWDDV